MKKSRAAYSKYAVLIIMLFFYSYTYSMVYSFYNVVSLDLLGEKSSIFHFRVMPLSFSAGLFIVGLLLSFKPISSKILNRVIGVVTLITTPLILMVFNSKEVSVFLATYYILVLSHRERRRTGQRDPYRNDKWYQRRCFYPSAEFIPEHA